MTLEKANGVATARCTTEASNALITYLNYSPDNAELIAVATELAVMGAIIRFVNHCKLNGLTELVKDLKQLEDKIAFLTMHVESLEEIAAHKIQHQLQNYLQSTKKGIRYYSFGGERTKEQARKMIIETKDLKRGYHEIFEQANQTRLYLKKYLV